MAHVVPKDCKDFTSVLMLEDKVTLTYKAGVARNGWISKLNPDCISILTPTFNQVYYLDDLSKPNCPTIMVHSELRPINNQEVEQSKNTSESSTKHKTTDITPESTTGIKFDTDKLQWWYMWQFLPELEQIVSVLQYGDTKYPAEDGSNWKRLPNLERRASSAAMRHLSTYLSGDKLDNETNKSHLAHCIANLLFLMYNDRHTK